MRGRRSLIVVALATAVLGACGDDGPTAPLAADPSTTNDGAQLHAAYLQEVLKTVEAHAYYADRIDVAAWNQRIAATTAAGPMTLYDDLRFVGRLLAELGDHHSFRLSPGEWARLNDTVDSDILTSPPPQGDVDGNVGYLQLPAVEAEAGSGAYDAYVNAARRVLADPACGWILDLRANLGGGVPPMLAAIAPLLGPGTFIGYRDLDQHVLGFRINDDDTVTVVHDAPMDGPSTERAGTTKLSTVPVALLTGRSTASAAEAIAVAFIGRRSTRSFGSPTAGVPTANSTFELSDHSALALTTAVGVDRLGASYDSALRPNVPVAAPTSLSEHDTVVAAATTWLNEQSTCKTRPPDTQAPSHNNDAGDTRPP
jgi:hypothetical protein